MKQSSLEIISISNHDNLCNSIVEALFSRILSRQETLISQEKPENITIIKKLHQGKSAALAELINGAEDKVEMDKVIQDMIQENILRYDKKATSKWHGRIQENEFSE